MINTEELKKIEPEVILNLLSIPYRRTGNRIMAEATFRAENTASISIQHKEGKYLWKDFGGEIGGSWIDLVMLVRNCDYLSAIKFLNYINGGQETVSSGQINIDKQDGKTKKGSEINIISVEDKITDKNLIWYLRSRAIKSIPEWLLQINYEVIKNGKKYNNSALCVKNEKGGYALRNQRIKMNIGPASYSLIKNAKTNNKIIATEGMFDCLSIYQYLDNDLKVDILILNSTENLNKSAIAILNNYKNIVLVLDNDEGGKKVSSKVKESLKGKTVKDNSYIYKDYKDFNECYMDLMMEEKN
ncbi:MAG: toprim domain-containing protein [bacterium]